MKIKFTDLYKLIHNKKEIFDLIRSLIKKSNFIGGAEVQKFELNFRKYIDIKYCVSLGNGTDALEIAVQSLNLKKKSEIIVPANTWISTAEAVVTNGHKLVFCDVDMNDYSICLKDLKKKINSRTRAIIPVHLYGIASNIKAIKKMVGMKNIKIIEDCAQAHGATYDKKKTGSMGDVGCFSFFPGKNLGAFGDAGALVTNSKKIYTHALRLRNHGALKKYDHKFSGRNSRMDAINAGVLNLKLKNFNKTILKRNRLANIYYKELKDIPNLYLFKLNKKNITVYHQFVIRTNKRNQLKEFLARHKIETMIHYPYMLNDLKFFNYHKKINNCNNLGKKILSLPISEEHSEKQILFVSRKIKEFFKI